MPLKQLIRNEQPQPRSLDDLTETLKLRAALNRAGYDASLPDIEWAWGRHSQDWAAGWLVLESCGGADGGVKYLLEYLIPAASLNPTPEIHP